MLRRTLVGSILYILLTVTAAAKPPSVAVDITPIHSLVAQVMDGVGSPNLIIQPGASPHSYSLSPSEAEALQNADVVFWISEELTPWLKSSLANLAGSAQKVQLLETPGTTLHAFREGATFESHEHHDDEHAEEHAEEGQSHAEDHHNEHAKEEDESHEKDHHDEHSDDNHEKHKDEHHHGEHDPHAWLDPENAKVWVQVISETLSQVDPANAEVYQSNATKATAELESLINSVSEQAKRLSGIKFIVFHDAYRYFEQRFAVHTSGAISLGDASDPSPARVKEIRDTVTELGINCVFTEPQYNPKLVQTVFDGTSVTTIGVMDPLGADIATGKDLYANLIQNLVSSLNQCQD